MRGGAILLAVCVAGCVPADHGFLRPRPAPVGMDARSPCANLKQLYSINPIYPRQAMPVKQDGWVLLQYDVAAAGVPFNVVVLDSSPQGVFDQASINALVQWRYARKSFATSDCVHLDTYSTQ